jgi:hypothetical protein
MSPYSPIKSMRGKTSEAGMDWGWYTCDHLTILRMFSIIGTSSRWDP